ncbi:hypothetical protein BX600DRAFT_460508 [Xylariales sp. PMI_506]|nr:hypothetical protein BX600DRAFT_460508 [Xylariales sp. PMI_506]
MYIPFLALSLWLPAGLAAMIFINPPPFGAPGDFSQDTIYAEGSTVIIQWTAGIANKPISVALFQLNGSEPLYPFEYIIESAINITSFTWIVATTKNITFSPIFYMSIYEDGNGVPDANTHYFNISAKGSADPHTSAISTTTASISSLSSATSSADTSTEAASSQVAPASDSSLAIKIGVGLGIPLALVIGLAAGWLIFAKHCARNKNQPPPLSFGGSSSSYGGSAVSSSQKCLTLTGQKYIWEPEEHHELSSSDKPVAAPPHELWSYGTER